MHLNPPIPLHRPALVGAELDALSRALAGGMLDSGGAFTRRCSAWLEASLGTPRALLTHSCTGALELAALLCGVGPGDEVIVPSFTFTSTANAFALRGARLRFVDVRPDTLNLDEARVEEALTPRTRAICAVHYAGVGADMDALGDIARRRGLTLIEDAAQAIDASWRGRKLGTLGALGCLSFHATKNVSCGEGGALLVNDPSLLDRAEVAFEKGTDRRRFLRGEVDRYRWVELGSSYACSELTAALLLPQLEATARITEARRAVFARYLTAFADLAARGAVRLPTVPDACEPNGHIFYLLVDAGRRDGLLAHLRAAGVGAAFHYQPLHDTPAGKRFGDADGALLVTEAIASQLVRLPIYPDLTDDEQRRVVGAVTSFFAR